VSGLGWFRKRDQLKQRSPARVVSVTDELHASLRDP
jgi:hypothetical protein